MLLILITVTFIATVFAGILMLCNAYNIGDKYFIDDTYGERLSVFKTIASGLRKE